MQSILWWLNKLSVAYISSYYTATAQYEALWIQFTMLQFNIYRLQHVKRDSCFTCMLWSLIKKVWVAHSSVWNVGKLVRLCNTSYSSPSLIHAASSLSLWLCGNNTFLFSHKILNNPKRVGSLLSFNPQRCTSVSLMSGPRAPLPLTELPSKTHSSREEDW